MRSPEDIIGEKPVCPSADDETNSRALSLGEVKGLRDDFIASAVRAKKSGYDGVEIHGAHGYILCQFLSSSINKREDEYGGSLENRSCLLYKSDAADDTLLVDLVWCRNNQNKTK